MMRLKKMPIAGTPVSLKGFAQGLKPFAGKGCYLEGFRESLTNLLNVSHCFTIGSGTAAFYIILKVLAKLSNRREVILPAYTAPALMLPIRKLGLEPKLCDISLDNFGMDIGRLRDLCSQDTLCIVAVHLFGIPCQIRPLIDIAKGKGIFVIDDAAQAMGTTLDGRMVGTIGDVGFYSFAKGKNLSTYSGGAIVTNSLELSKKIEEELEVISDQNLFSKIGLSLKLSTLALCVRPQIYGIFYRAISQFKVDEVPEDFPLSLYTDLQAAVGLSLLERFESFCQKRQLNGLRIYEGLKDTGGITLPGPIENARPVYNRFPVVFEDVDVKEEVQRQLFKEGIETSELYRRPLHHIFDLGLPGDRDPYPRATYLAERLLTLPTHPIMDEKSLKRMILVIKNETLNNNSRL